MSINKEELNRSVLNVLKEARNLIKKRNGWGRHYFAVNKSGFEVNPTSPDAVRFCPQGALRAAINRFEPMSRYSILELSLRLLTNVIGNANIPAWNDAPGRTQDEVVEAFDASIWKLIDEMQSQPCPRTSSLL